MFVTDDLEKLGVGVLALGFMLRGMGGTVAPITPKLIELAI
ncbi:hypothetical protein ACWATR_26745 [Nostoc sp. UIC 10890]